MKIRFTKINPTHHLFEVIRHDGTREEKLLESKSLMPHDLIHFAYESTAQLKESFYGKLASGTTMEKLDDKTFMSSPLNKNAEITQTERIVGPLTAYLNGVATEEQIISSLQNLFEADGSALPPHISVPFLKELKDIYRGLVGHWQSLPHHKAMEIEWK